MSNASRLRNNQVGMINALLIPLTLCIVLLLGAIGFGAWAFMSRQDYKDNVDEKVKTAVGVAVKETETRKDNEFQEKEKLPLATYQGPSASGSILVKYPKTWSAYVESSDQSSTPLNAYFHPTVVPGTQSNQTYALRVEVVQQSFSDVIKSYDSVVRQGRAQSQPFTLTNVPSVVGLRLQGEIEPRQQGIVVVLPLRDKTIKVYTESDQYFNDFNNNVLPNFSFTP